MPRVRNTLFQVEDRHATLDISSGEKWRSLRKNMSATFTAGKLKGMLEPMSGLVDGTIAHVDGLVERQGKDGDIDLTQDCVHRCVRVH